METLLSQSHSRQGDEMVLTQYKSPASVPMTSVIPVLVPTVKPISAFVVEIGKPFVNCLKKSQDKLNEKLASSFATISVDTEMEQVYIIPCPGCELLEDWKPRCQSIVERYLGDFATDTVSFPGEIKGAVVPVIINCMQNYSLLDITFDQENCTVSMSGEKQMVEIMKCRIEEICDSEIPKTEPVSVNTKFLAFLNLKVDELLENHPEIKASIDPQKCTVSIVGTKSKRDAFKKGLDLLKESMICITVGISNDILQFLSTTTGGKSLLQKYLQGFESHVTLHFDPKEVLILLCSKRNVGAHVAEKIEKNIVSTIVPHPTIFLLHSLQSEKWGVFQSNLEETYLVSVCFANDQLTIIGDKKSVDLVEKDIRQFIENECNEEKSIPLYGAQWRLLNSHMASKWSTMKQKLENESKIKYSLPNEKDENVFILLRGEKPIVADFTTQIKQLISSISTSPTIEIARPGPVNFFFSKKGTTLVKRIEAEEKSCIQLDVLQDGSDDVAEGEATKGGSDRVCMGTTNEGKVITLIQGDITEFPADVIVNAANAELKHVGGVALAISEKGGPVIQEESNRLILREGRLKDGDAIMTKEVGKLPCKRLIHAVGLKWNGGLFRKACLESLKLATNYRIVSFPIVSSGSPMNKCAESMMKAFMDYSASNPLSTLREIVIVVHDYSAISAFSHEMSQNLKKFQSAATSVPGSMPPPGIITVSKDSTHPHSKHRNPSRKSERNAISKADIITQFIQLHKGELLKQKVGNVSS